MEEDDQQVDLYSESFSPFSKQQQTSHQVYFRSPAKVIEDSNQFVELNETINKFQIRIPLLVVRFICQENEDIQNEFMILIAKRIVF